MTVTKMTASLGSQVFQSADDYGVEAEAASGVEDEAVLFLCFWDLLTLMRRRNLGQLWPKLVVSTILRLRLMLARCSEIVLPIPILLM